VTGDREEFPVMTEGEDERIRDDVSERIAAEFPAQAAQQIQVEVTHGEVTLAGTVETSETRRRAEDVAGSITGVEYVTNNLRVRQRAARVLPADGALSRCHPLKPCASGLVTGHTTVPNADEAAPGYEDQDAAEHYQERRPDPRRAGG
jgi:BON domain